MLFVISRNDVISYRLCYKIIHPDVNCFNTHCYVNCCWLTRIQLNFKHSEFPIILLLDLGGRHGYKFFCDDGLLYNKNILWRVKNGKIEINLRNNFQAQNVCDNESVILLLYKFKNNYLSRF